MVNKGKKSFGIICEAYCRSKETGKIFVCELSLQYVFVDIDLREEKECLFGWPG